MNRVRQYLTPLTASVLALFIVLIPGFAFAQQEASFIQGLVWDVLIAITGSILYISGIVFDFSVNSFVIGFADYYTNSGVGFAVDRTWVTIRDFVNLFFIFGLVYIGFKMILDSDDSNTRRWLVNLIIAALLINFSLFITKFAVDFSNQISTQIAISGFGATQTGTTSTGQPGAYEVDITDQILNLMGIKTLFELDGGQYTGYGWGYIFGTAIMFLVTSFVLIAGGFLLTIRFAMLNLFMVLSPFMFIGWILPPLSNLTSKYWDAFLRRAFFAPVYFLFLYFSLEILKAFQGSLIRTGGLGKAANIWNAADSATTLSTTQSTMPFFILICIFLIASIVISQKIGADGSGTAIRYGQMARNKLQRGVTRGVGASTAGLAARTGRNTIGRAAYAATQNEKLKSYAARSAVGKGLYKTAQYGSKATFDARNVGGVGKQLNLGESAKGGFEQRVKDAKKREDAFIGKDGLGFTDLDKEENKVRVTAEQSRIETEAKKEKEIAEASQKEFNDNLNTSTEQFTAGITALTTEITNLEEELEKGTREGTLTDKDKAERQKALEIKKTDLSRSQGTLEKLARTEEKRNAWIQSRNVMTAANSDANASEADKAQARDAFEKAEAAYTKQIADERASIQTDIKNADKKFADAEVEAKASIKYEKQRAYIEQKKREERLWKSTATLGLSSGGGGLVGGILTTSAAGFGFGAGSALASAGAKGAVTGEVISELDDKYGKGGTKAVKKEQKKKKLADVAAALGTDKKEGEADDGGKKEDGDKKDDE